MKQTTKKLFCFPFFEHLTKNTKLKILHKHAVSWNSRGCIFFLTPTNLILVGADSVSSWVGIMIIINVNFVVEIPHRRPVVANYNML